MLRRAIEVGGNGRDEGPIHSVPARTAVHSEPRRLARPHGARSVARLGPDRARLAPIAASLIKHDPAIRPNIERVKRAWPTRLGMAEFLGDAGMAAISDHRLLTTLLDVDADPRRRPGAVSHRPAFCPARESRRPIRPFRSTDRILALRAARWHGSASSTSTWFAHADGGARSGLPAAQVGSERHHIGYPRFTRSGSRWRRPIFRCTR